MQSQSEQPDTCAARSGKAHSKTSCKGLWKDCLIALGGGVLLALAFPPYDLGNMVWVALLPLLSVLWRGHITRKRAFGLGWLYGMGCYCVSFWWIHEVGYVFGIPQPLFLAVAFVPLMAVYSCLPGLWALAAGSWLRPYPAPLPQESASSPTRRRELWAAWAAADLRSTLRSAIGLGALWVCIEWLRAHGTLGFSWNSLGTALYGGLSLVQWAEFVGTCALSFVPVSMSVIVWRALRRTFLHFKGAGVGCRPWDFYAGVVLLFLLFGGGLMMSRLYAPATMLKRSEVFPLPVMALQINKDQTEHISSPRSVSQYHEYLNATVEAFNEIARDTMRNAQRSEDVGLKLQLPVWVVWPESALPFPFYRDADTRRLLTDAISNEHLLQGSGLPLARQRVREMGGQDFTLFTGVDEALLRNDERGLSFCGLLNSLAAIPDGAESIRTASKQHLMPFGEYIPLAQDIKWIGEAYSRITGTQVGDGIIPGAGSAPLPVPIPGAQLTVGAIPAVCYEDTVGDLLRLFARPGPQVIVNVTNDGWFRESSCGVQQARAAAMRCIELRRPMVRAANMGLCCAIAPNGAVIHSLKKADGSPHLPGYSYAILPVDTKARLTLYAAWGDWAVLLCLLIALAFAGYDLANRRRCVA